MILVDFQRHRIFRYPYLYLTEYALWQMATITPIIRTSKRDNRGRCPIWLRISDRSSTRFVSLGERVLPTQWNPRTQRVRQSHVHADLINELIRSRVQELEAEVLRMKIDGQYATADDLKSIEERKAVREDFFACCESYLTDLQRQGRMLRHDRLRSTLGKLESFTGTPLPFDRITPRLLADFETHCVADLGNRRTTVGTNLADLRTLWNLAVRDGYADAGASPFEHITIRRGKARERVRLSSAEIEALRTLDLPDASQLAVVRDMFCFAFYAGGLRFHDLLFLRPQDIETATGKGLGRLKITASKTGKPLSVQLPPAASEIARRYQMQDSDFLFPFATGFDVATARQRADTLKKRTALYNRYLKKIAHKAGIQKSVSSHVARHSFADLARRKGWTAHEIKQALQHSSVRETEQYLAGFDSDLLDKRFGQLFDTTD